MALNQRKMRNITAKPEQNAILSKKCGIYPAFLKFCPHLWLFDLLKWSHDHLERDAVLVDLLLETRQKGNFMRENSPVFVKYFRRFFKNFDKIRAKGGVDICQGLW
jgi:hypothetical protein